MRTTGSTEGGCVDDAGATGRGNDESTPDEEDEDGPCTGPTVAFVFIFSEASEMMNANNVHTYNTCCGSVEEDWV